MQDSIQDSHCVFLRLFLILTVSEVFLVFDELDSLKYWSVFCRMPANWTSSDVFPWLEWGVSFCVDNHRDKVLFSSYYIEYMLLTWHHCCWLWSHGLRWCWSGFCPISFLPSSPLPLEGSHYLLPTPEGWVAVFHSHKNKASTKLFGIFLHGSSVYFPNFFLYLIIYISMNTN